MPVRFARIHSLRAMTHDRDRKPATLMPVCSVMSDSAIGTSSPKSSRMRARCTAGTEMPGPATRRPSCSAVSQSARRAAAEPMDQSTSVACNACSSCRNAVAEPVTDGEAQASPVAFLRAAIMPARRALPSAMRRSVPASSSSFSAAS